MTEDVTLRMDSAGLATLTLNRPEKLNSLTISMFEALDHHLDHLRQSTNIIGAVLIRGAGKCFSAGNDLNEINQVSHRSNVQPRVIEKLAGLPQPVVAAVHGYCFTGALELALAADFILASDTAQLADTHAKFGLTSLWGMSQRLPRRVGTARAKEMMFTARHFSGNEAKAIGLVNDCFREREFEEAVGRVMQEILENSWASHRVNKRVLEMTEGLPITDGLAYEADHHPGITADAAQRIAAFARKD